MSSVGGGGVRSSGTGKRDTRTALLDAAWELVRERGLDVPMKDVAAAVGISRQALYLHFPSRAHLLRAMTVHHDRRARVRERFADALEQAEATDALDAVVEVWFDYVAEILPVARGLAAAAVTDPTAAEAWWDANERAQAIITHLVQRLADEGALTPGWEVTEAVEYLWSITHVRAYDDLVIHHGWDHDQFVRRHIETLRAVLLSEPTTSAAE